MSAFEAFANHLEALGPWGPVLFLAVYVAGSLAFIPGAALSVMAGAVFGLAQGVPIVFAGAVLGSSAAFGLARTLAHDRVTRWLSRNRRAAAIGQAVASRGLLVVVLLRLSPVLPYNVLNYALGVSRVRYRDFLLGSVGMLPGTVLYTFTGKVAGDVAAVAAGAAPPRGAGYYSLLGVGLAATVLVTIVITRAARQALEQPHDR